jgi:hypothetical protein
VDFLEATHDLTHHEYKPVWAWNSGPFAPHEFDLNTIKQPLMKLNWFKADLLGPDGSLE